jgi:hypothetical protein
MMHGPKTIATGAAGVRRGGHLLAAAAGFITVTTHTEAQTHERASAHAFIVPTSNTLGTQKQNSQARRRGSPQKVLLCI